MVLFDNIVLNQKVEVKRKGRVYRGVVKYKGPLNGIVGDWVGISLDTPVGKHDGRLMGRRYFLCPPKHGIFTEAANVRFIPLQRCLYDKYRTVDLSSSIDEELFRTEKPKVVNGPQDPVNIGEAVVLSAKSAFSDRPGTVSVSGRRYHPLRHSVGSHIAAATMRPFTAQHTLSYSCGPLHVEYEGDPDEDFITSPSIPKTHMPRSALKRQVQRGWDNAHYVRHMTVNTGRHTMNRGMWNTY